MSVAVSNLRRVWKSAQLSVGFHRDPAGKERDHPHVWSPKNGRASIHPDPEEQEAFVMMRSAENDSAQDIQIKLHPEMIVLRRDFKEAWQGLKIDAFVVTVKVGDTIIRIGPDESISRKSSDSTTWIEADGQVLKISEYVTASMSGDGVTLKRRTPDGVAAITENGVIWKER